MEVLVEEYPESVNSSISPEIRDLWLLAGAGVSSGCCRPQDIEIMLRISGTGHTRETGLGIKRIFVADSNLSLHTMDI